MPFALHGADPLSQHLRANGPNLTFCPTLSYVFVQGLNAAGSMRMAYTFPMTGVLSAIAAGLIFGVLAALLPARHAASMEIIRALRYE